MSTSSLSLFFALLAVAAWAATLIVWAAAVAHRRAPDSALGTLFDDIGRLSLWIAALVAIVTTCGSLYYSEVAHFVSLPLMALSAFTLVVTLVLTARATAHHPIPIQGALSCS